MNRRFHRLESRTWIAAALLAFAGAAGAHDTWFAAVAEAPGTLALGTGNRFPVAESAVDPTFFARAGCVQADGGAVALTLIRFTDNASHLRPGSPSAATCFAQLVPFDIELAPDKVGVYFREIRPAAAMLTRRTAHAAQGVAFRERYTKHARIELDPRAAARPAGMAMDVVRTAPLGAVTVGTEATFQVLREGQPLGGFAVEFVSERSAVGIWLRTDDEGRVRIRLPFAGAWVLRGTELRAGDGDGWESGFVTYAFRVG